MFFLVKILFVFNFIFFLFYKMNSDKSNLFNSYNTKPKHLLKYQSIFKELLDNQNLFGNNENEKQKKQTSKDFFHIHNNPMKNALYSTRYQLITGRNIDTHSFLNKNKNQNQINNQSYNMTNPNFSNTLNYKTNKQENIKKFKRFLKQTDLQYSNNNNSSNNNFINNNNNNISFNRNSFIQKLHSTLPEYTSLSNKGNSFLTLNNQTFKNSDFSYLRNKLK